jgi:ABC-type arginine/histidine transport system permease subunit
MAKGCSFFWKNNKILVRNLRDYTNVFDSTPMLLQLLLVQKIAGTGDAMRILLGEVGAILVTTRFQVSDKSNSRIAL